jgi:hypothetical protein
VIITWNASICDLEEFLISTRIAEECRVDGNGALPATGACAIQQEVDINVAVARERDLAQRRYEGIIASIARRFEYDDVAL